MSYKRKSAIIIPFVILLLVMCFWNGESVNSAMAFVSHSYIANDVRYHMDEASIRLHAFVSQENHLQADQLQWAIFHDQGYSDGKLEKATMPGAKDQNLLKVSLLSGQPYAGIHAYRDLPPNNKASAFHMHIRFYFPDKKSIQALEFTMNKWSQNQRWEWALQWQVVPDGSSFQGKAETWRVWDGAHWQDIEVQQTLSAAAWHTLDLYGIIENGHVRYQTFRSDGRIVNIQHYTFPLINSPGEKLAVGVQLDGNAYQNPYPLYLDDVSLESS